MTHPFIFLRVMAEDYIHEDAALANLQDELEEKDRIIEEKTQELQSRDEELQEKDHLIDEKTREKKGGDRKGYQQKGSITATKG